jgi:hypothetical protein
MKRRRVWIGLPITLALVLPAPLALVSAAPPTVVYFPATGHNLGGAFLAYWRRKGGLPQFGYPLTEEFHEAGGGAYQYFERARFEYHPENVGTPYDAVLGHLGRQIAQERGVSTAAASRAECAPDYDEGLFATPTPARTRTPQVPL